MEILKTKRARTIQPIRKETLKKVCYALVEISQLNEQERVPANEIYNICNKYKVYLLVVSLRELGYIKKIGRSYQVLFKREVCNEKMAINLYRFYRNFKNRQMNTWKTRNERVEQLKVDEVPFMQEFMQEVPIFKEQLAEVKPKEMFAVFAQQDVEMLMDRVVMYESLEDLKNNPPKNFGKYSIVTIGRSFEVKPQVVLD